jgi:formylglycine-generating enzyme required for sulfatase activity
VTDGPFLAGEGTQTRVDLPAFYLGINPVSNRQYQRFVKATLRTKSAVGWNQDKPPKRQEDHPVLVSDFEDAHDYCVWAGLRLPGEMEWEKGARGTAGRRYPWGNEAQPGTCRQAEDKTATCAWRYPRGCSPWGFHGMFGEAGEWCGEWDRQQPMASYKGGRLLPAMTGQRHARVADWIKRSMLTGAVIGGNFKGQAAEVLAGLGFRVARSLPGMVAFPNTGACPLPDATSAPIRHRRHIEV